MTLLITGGCGFIGSALVFRALAEGEKVVTLDKLTYAANPQTVAALQSTPGHHLEIVDIVDRTSVAACLERHRPSAVLHLAAESHVDRSIDRPGDFVQTNLVGTASVLDAALAYWRQLPPNDQSRFRLLHVSTDEVFGSLGASGQFHENSIYAPNSPYAASKAGADHLARAWHQTYGLPVIVSNCSNNYGPRQFPEKLLPLMILNALAGKALPVYGDGLNIRDWLYVEDHAEALLTLIRRAEPGSRYMIGGGAERTNLDIVREICDRLDAWRPAADGQSYARWITHVPDRPGHDRRYAADFSRITADFGWRPRHDLSAGLAATVQWYLDNPTWCDACGDIASHRQGQG